jgi:hypothetical protein
MIAIKRKVPLQMHKTNSKPIKVNLQETERRSNKLTAISLETSSF